MRPYCSMISLPFSLRQIPHVIPSGVFRLTSQSKSPSSAFQTSERVWRVRVPAGLAPGEAITWLGLPPHLTPGNTVAGDAGEAYLWLPDGAYTFSSQTASGSQDLL